MNYIILDIEATNGNPKEIIELGAVKLNEDLVVVDSFQSFVKPIINPKLCWFIKDLTKIKQSEIDNAHTYPVVHNQFLQWVGEDSIILTWGKDDKKFINKNIMLHGLDNAIIQKFVNIQRKISSILKYGNGLIGLKMALYLLDMTQDGQHHRALDDAFNTSKLFVKFFHQLGNLQDIQDQNIKEEKAKNIIKFDKKANYKIDYRRYYKHLSKLTIFELKNKLKMLENLLEIEVKKIKDVAGYFYTIIVMKKNCVKKILSNKMQELALKQAGLTLRQIEVPLKAINQLYTLKERLIIRSDDYSKKVFFETQSKIEKLKQILKRINKPLYNNHNKEKMIQYYEEILQLMSELLKSKHFRPKYKVHVEGLYERVKRNLDNMNPYVQQAM